MNEQKKKHTPTVIGIDVGGSTTKIVGFRQTESGAELIRPEFVRAADPVTSIYGAFGKFTFQNELELSDIDRVMVTGVGATYLNKPIYSGLACYGHFGRMDLCVPWEVANRKYDLLTAALKQKVSQKQ